MFEFLFGKRELLPLPYHRELHCHLIPGIDDGSPQLDVSLKLCDELIRFGVERVIFTPHHTHPRFLNTPEIVQPLFDELKQTLEQKQSPLVAEDYSFEYRIDESFMQLMQTGKFGDPACQIRPLYGRYLLIENSYTQPLASLDRIIEVLQEQGYYLILAHPERYHYYSQDHKYRKYEHLQSLQVEFQCNMLSFCGYYGKEAKKAAYWMLDQGYVNFLGSDMHNLRHCQLLDEFLRTKDYRSIREELIDQIGNDRMKK